MICAAICTFVLFFTATIFLAHQHLHYYWSKRKVFYLRNSDVASLRERLSLSIHEFDKKRYDKMKDLQLPYAVVTDIGRTTLFVVDLELTKQILIKDFDNFINRGSFDSQINIKYYGDMLLMKENEDWRKLRNVLSRIFTSSRLKTAFEAFESIGNEMIEYIVNRNGGKNGEFNVSECVGKCTMEGITSAAFGVSCGMFEDGTNMSVFAEMKEMFQKDMAGPLGMLLAIWLPKISALLKIPIGSPKATEFFVKVLKKTINERKATNESKKDFLQVLLDAQKRENSENLLDKKEEISDDVVVAQCLMFFVAGFDSTESIIVLAAYELAKNPNVQTKLFEEIDAATNKSGRKEFSYEIINSLQYLEQVFSEILRTYSFGIRAERKTSEDYKIPNTESIIPKNTMVDIPVWSIHHDEKFYRNPMSFDPERFTKENISKRHPNCYMPFGVGPRHCIAMRYATIQTKVVIAKLVHNFKLEPSRNTPSVMEFKKTAIMKPVKDLWLSFKCKEEMNTFKS